MLNDFLHGYDRCCAETVFLLDLCECGFLAFSSLAAVNRDNKTENIDIALCLDDRKCLLDGCTRCCHVLDDNDLVTVSDRAAKKDSLVAVIFYFFSVGAVFDVCAEVLVDRHAGRNSQRDSLVSRSEENIEVCSKCVIDRFRIVLAELAKLSACAIESCVYEERGLSSALCHEVSKF